MSHRFYSRKCINVKRFIPFAALCLLLICAVIVGMHALFQKTKISYDDSILGSAYADSEMPVPTATPKPTVPPGFIVETARHEADFIDIYNQYEQRIAYLTFDDGPNAQYTPLLLDGLKKRNIRASFFLIGENIEGNEDILLQMRKDGHLIGNHTWDHVQLDKIPAEKARLEIEKTNNRIYEASGIYPSYVRPPFGAWIKNLELSVTMFPVFWDVDTLDWKSQNVNSILSVAEKQIHDGSIILMHDGYQTSVDAALKITDLFTEKGYVFVTADQLLLT